MIINDYLKNNNLSRYQFAKMCNLPYGTLNDICNGKTDIAKCTGETLLKIANAIGCSVDMLLKERLSAPAFNLERIKKAVAPVAAKHKLRSVYVFGSYARNEATEESDVDILIDREGSEIHGIFAMNALYNELKAALGKDIDLVTLQSLRQKSTLSSNGAFIENVMNERVKIYG